MSDEINIDCAADENEAEWRKIHQCHGNDTDPRSDAEILKAQIAMIEQLREQLSAERRLNASLRAELDELHARHRPKEDQ